MTVAIALNDFDHHRERYQKLRLGIFNHQPSGVEANERDLNLFSDFFHEKNINKITGEGILDFLCYLREDRSNQAGSLNRKESSIRSYLKFLRFSQVNGADQFPIESLQRAKEPYNGPVESLEPEEVIKLLSAIDRNSVLGSRDFLFYYLLYRLGLRIGETVKIDIQDIDFEKDILTIHGKGRNSNKGK